MLRKQSQDEQNMQGLSTSANIANRLQKIQAKSQKMYDRIEQIINKTIQAIDESQNQIMKEEGNFNNQLMNLHLKMTQIKPLKSIKDEYNDFYKKLSGFGKIIQQIPPQNQIKIKSPKLFEERDIGYIEECISDHYLSQQNYEAAKSIIAENAKTKLFQECFLIRDDILQGNFDRAAQWIQKMNLNQDYWNVGYEIHKMKIICLVKQNKADQAISYLRQKLANYSNKFGSQMSKLMSFIITNSCKYWGGQPDYLGVYKNRYNVFNSVSLQQLAQKFTNVFLKVNKIYITNPVSQCYQVGFKFRQEFLQQLKYLPTTQQLPNTLPFAIKTGPQNKYHSYFFCPVNKQVFNSLDKNVVLNCGHMVSHLAIHKLTQGKDSRRKMKCPICQSDQIIQNNLKVQF